MTQQDNSQKSASELLNIYINSGGTKASYDDVVRASRRERIEKTAKDLKEKHPVLFPLYFMTYFFKELAND